VIIITDEMQKTVDNNPVKFVLKRGPVINGIFADGIDTDEKIAGKTVAAAIVESDDIRVIIVLEILEINVKDVIIRTENDGNITEPTDLAFCDSFKPLPA
jgi:hypothetical protein